MQCVAGGLREDSRRKICWYRRGRGWRKAKATSPNQASNHCSDSQNRLREETLTVARIVQPREDEMDGCRMGTRTLLWPSISLSHMREKIENKTRMGKCSPLDP